MATRDKQRQSEHDAAVYAAGEIYRDHGWHVVINLGDERNQDWNGRYIDVIAAPNLQPDKAWVTEIETSDSVTDNEARSQWQDYDSVFESWALAVPEGLAAEAERLLRQYTIQNCTLIAWRRSQDGTHTFSSLPGLS